MKLEPGLEGSEADDLVGEALAAAGQLGLAISVAVVDAGGFLLALRRMDGAGRMTADVARRKARTAALLRAPSRVLADSIAANPALLALDAYLPMAGGIPVQAEGLVAGGIGISGGTASEDEKIATAALAQVFG